MTSTTQMTKVAWNDMEIDIFNGQVWLESIKAMPVLKDISWKVVKARILAIRVRSSLELKIFFKFK